MGSDAAKVANVVEALLAATHLDSALEQPFWLDNDERPDAHELVVTTNGILHVSSRRLQPHSPRLFTGHALPFAFEAAAPTPDRWFGLLDEIWPEDPESVALLHEIFGYAVSADAGLQKIMLLVGPPRAGNGVIANVLPGTRSGGCISTRHRPVAQL